MLVEPADFNFQINKKMFKTYPSKSGQFAGRYVTSHTHMAYFTHVYFGNCANVLISTLCEKC